MEKKTNGTTRKGRSQSRKEGLAGQGKKRKGYRKEIITVKNL